MWLDYLGKFHPVVLHLPIGALLFTFLMALMALKQFSAFSRAIKLGLLFSFCGALLSSVLGYLLFRSGGYEQATIQNHQILGWLSTVSTGVLWYLFGRVSFHRIFLPFFGMTVFTIGLTGHLGGQITHGEEYLKLPEVEEKQSAIIQDSISFYSTVVTKIFDRKCVQCHNFSKRKGGLALSEPGAILEGGDHGLAYIAGSAKESKLITYAKLPLEDDLHMPPKGRVQLTSNEISLLSYWIDQGASFDALTALKSHPESVQQAMLAFLPQALPEVSPLEVDVLKTLQATGFQVWSYSADSNFIQAKFNKKTLDQAAVNALRAAANQLIELALPNVELSSYFWKHIAEFTQLKKLRLENTNVQDIDLKKIESLPLQSLNLTGTQITTAGIKPLLMKSSLDKIYLWNTKISRLQEEELQKQTISKLVFGVFEGFSSPQQLKLPRLITEKTFFDQSILVNFENKVSGNLIRYTLDNSIPDSTSTIYREPIHIDKTLTLKARNFKSGWLSSEVFTEDFFKVNTRIENYNILIPPSNRYAGVHKLFDFEEGSENFADGKWIGFSGSDLVLTTKISGKAAIENITVSCLESIGGWIIYPKRIGVYSRKAQEAYSLVGQYNYHPKNIPTETTKKSFTIPVSVDGFSELKIVVENIGKLPNWHPAAGEDAWLFIDEILFW